ncbi:MAG TPA: zinc-dependent metalloprotease [Solirubrobacteraceae bacterium]|nr:zinc-dependent metalloprotease [Solirubrobacteraceae bacterium]
MDTPSGARSGIDWSVAQRVGEMLSGGAPYVSTGAGGVQGLAEDFAARVSAYTALPLNGGIPKIESIDRPRWIEANIATMRPLLDPLTRRVGKGSGPLAPALRSTTQLLLGVQVGAVTGMLSQRVLGQYDIALLDAEQPPRLLLLAPNIAQAARNLQLDREQFTSWVAIHEVTHAVQFSGAPWLRGYLGGMLRELLDGMQVGVRVSGLPSLPSAGDLRTLVERLRAGELLRVGLGEERWALVERMQATMSLIEGHAEHVMDAVGAEVLPTLERMRTAMTRRRSGRAWPWRILERLLGLEMKMRQYEVGRSFCDEVVKAGGPERLAHVWSSSWSLPSTAELSEPQLWLERTNVPSVTS